jgi:hypothetical protein
VSAMRGRSVYEGGVGVDTKCLQFFVIFRLVIKNQYYLQFILNLTDAVTCVSENERWINRSERAPPQGMETIADESLLKPRVHSNSWQQLSRSH